ncbi:hypothetical protein [Melittangium boletus]|uniref:SDR family oxidoreductase n=1 Tax=Melittangium boletus DSM 14713 TaxID=1294270 RepID=A0A250IP05_9BACT|nr:hypothetical protein [Melittangium boletus]ATB33464.1 SDR family oxidoreductase [Melittangium boletus DSM 14713]
MAASPGGCTTPAETGGGRYARALLKVVDAEKPPLRVLFGQMPTKLVQHLYTQRLKTWGEWEQVSVEAEGTSPS